MNRFKNQIALAAGFVVLASVISGVTAIPAIAAAIKAALVQNIDERARVPYQKTFSGATVTNGPAVPTGKRLVIEHLSAGFSVENGTMQFVRADVNGTGIRTTFLKPVFAFASGATNTYLVNESVLTYVDGGESISTSMFFSTGTTDTVSSVTFSGYLVDCSPTSPCAAVAP